MFFCAPCLFLLRTGCIPVSHDPFHIEHGWLLFALECFHFREMQSKGHSPFVKTMGDCIPNEGGAG
jgi:hypothetical protein